MKSGKKLRKSGKNSNIKIAEIWEKSRYQKCGNMGKKCGNMATYDFSYAEFRQLIDFSQFAEIWENVAELWCFPLKVLKSLLLSLNRPISSATKAVGCSVVSEVISAINL
jgi:hypothetical protein